jgi:hypothetical protein
MSVFSSSDMPPVSALSMCVVGCILWKCNYMQSLISYCLFSDFGKCLSSRHQIDFLCRHHYLWVGRLLLCVLFTDSLYCLWEVTLLFLSHLLWFLLFLPRYRFGDTMNDRLAEPTALWMSYCLFVDSADYQSSHHQIDFLCSHHYLWVLVNCRCACSTRIAWTASER